MMLRSEEHSHLAHSLNQTFVGDPLDVALAAFREDLRAGCVKSILHYEGRFPEVAEDLRELSPSVAALEQASAHSMDQILRRNTPQRIGSYEIIAEIGRGGMAVVYRSA